MPFDAATVPVIEVKRRAKMRETMSSLRARLLRSEMLLTYRGCD